MRDNRSSSSDDATPPFLFFRPITVPPLIPRPIILCPYTPMTLIPHEHGRSGGGLEYRVYPGIEQGRGFKVRFGADRVCYFLALGISMTRLILLTA